MKKYIKKKDQESKKSLVPNMNEWVIWKEEDNGGTMRYLTPKFKPIMEGQWGTLK